MYLIGKAIVAFGALLDVLLILGIIAAALGAGHQLVAIGILGLPPTLLGLAILGVTWVAEGFMNGRRSGDARTPPSHHPVP